MLFTDLFDLKYPQMSFTFGEVVRKIVPSDTIHTIEAIKMKSVEQHIIEIVMGQYADILLSCIKIKINNIGYSETELKIIFAHYIYENMNDFMEDYIYNEYFKLKEEEENGEGEDGEDGDREEEDREEEHKDKFNEFFNDPLNKHLAVSIIYKDIVKRGKRYSWVSDEYAYMRLTKMIQVQFVPCYERRKWPIIAYGIA